MNSRLSTIWGMFAASLALLSGTAALGHGETKTIKAVMTSGLRIVDPTLTTSGVTRVHGYLVYDTLLATDENFKVRPQMADWKVSEDKLTYTFILRDGLKWHDGATVTAEDCVASLKRWGARDSMGQKLMQFTASLEASDPKTITLKLKEPYGLVLESLAKPSAYVPFMMPKRLAETPSDKAIPEQIGSGPFKFVQAEFQPGVKSVYDKNVNYVSRTEPPSWLAGGKRVKVDRVEWVTMPDPLTTINALQSGEIDFVASVPFDMLPILEKDENIEVRTLSAAGVQPVGRLNFLHPPFNDVNIRRAALLAMNQKDFLEAAVGNPNYYKICGAVFMCGSPLETDIGSNTLVKGGGTAEAKKLLAKSGYDGTPIVILSPTDAPDVKPLSVVAAQLLREVGFNVDLQAMDWNTLVNRRASKKSPKEGGWHMFFTYFEAAMAASPLMNDSLNARGTNGGTFGWPDDAKIEELRDAYARANSLDEQKKVAAEIQARVYDQVIYIPLGQFKYPSAWRKDLKGVLDSPANPVLWNIEKAK